jgi:peptidoglycan/LPS O-acetylase OafA/YrhL
LSDNSLATQPDRGQTRYPALDGVRGTAILMVFIFHFGGGTQSTNRAVQLIGWSVRAGWSGVTLFFVLSGFLISGLLWDARDAERVLQNFYLRRILRIFPLYYAALLLVFLTAVAAGHGLESLSHLWKFALYLQNVPGVGDTGNDSGSFLWLSHFWSLAVEEQFYLIWPFLLLRVKDLEQAKKLCIAVFLFSFLFRLTAPQAYFESLMARCDALAVGAYLAMCFRQPEIWANIQRLSRFAAPVLFAGFVCLALRTGTFWDTNELIYIWGHACVALFYGTFLVLAMGQGVTHSAMLAAPLRRIGTISYGIYVFHVLFIEKFRWIALHLAPHASRNTKACLDAIVAGVLSYGLASLSYRYFETPFLKGRSRFHPVPVSEQRALQMDTA